MDNDQIKLLFGVFTQDVKELKEYLKESIDAGKKEHNEIRIKLSEVWDRMKDVENVIDNHLINTVKKSKSNREKTLLIITVIASVMGILGTYARFI